MIIDVQKAAAKQYQVCVLGAGPAGIIFALEFAQRNPEMSVLLVECGTEGTIRNPLDETIVIRNRRNHHDPYSCTNKGLGGSTITWGGRCVMYDEVDFVPHGSVRDQCTWTPGFLAAMSPFLNAAGRYFECGEAVFSFSQLGHGQPVPIAEHFKPGVVTDDRLERWSLPTRFAKEYQRQLRNSRSIEVLCGHYATGFSELDSNSDVETVEVRSLTGTASHRLRAKSFVISAGGQESTRLLLKSPRLFRDLNGPPAALGRYYQGHVSGKIAFVKFRGDPDKTQYGFVRDSEGVYCRRRFQFTKEALVEHALLNTAFWLDIPPVYDPAHGNGTLSFIYLMMITPWLRKKLLPPAIAHALANGSSKSVGRHLWNVLRGLPASLVVPASIFFRRYLPRRKLPGVFLRSAANRYALHFHSEQVSLPQNQMTLGDDGNTLIIDFSYSDEDIQSVIRAHQLLDQSLREMGCGELEYLYPQEELPEAIRRISMDGLHQVGTTRIADNPRDGVVDRDLRVWGTRNLYVCSSSVFPTSSQANPTFFLGACAVRLAAHLSRSQESSLQERKP